MSFDIYGENLARGHCEVHPWVHCEYPCPTCIAESNKREADKRQESEYYRAMEDAHYAQMAADAEYESWTQEDK